MMRHIRLICLLSIPIALAAQQVDSTALSARISVHSIPSGAEVMIDTSLIGTTPLQGYVLMPGSYRLAVAFPSFRDWNAFQRSQDIHVRGGEDVSQSFEFGDIVRVQTDPSGAEVVYEGETLGKTPLNYRSQALLRSALLIRKDGFEDASVEPSMSNAVITLKPRGDSIQPSDIVVHVGGELGGPKWAVYSSAAGIVVSGVAAAYFKRLADNRFDDYAAYRNSADLDATRRYDAYAAVALVATQVSFVILTSLLLSE